MSTHVLITNVYSDRTNTLPIQVDTPDPRELDEWWDDVVFPFTGDGLGRGPQIAIYEAIITESDLPELVGKSYGWSG